MPKALHPTEALADALKDAEDFRQEYADVQSRRGPFVREPHRQPEDVIVSIALADSLVERALKNWFLYALEKDAVFREKVRRCVLFQHG